MDKVKNQMLRETIRKRVKANLAKHMDVKDGITASGTLPSDCLELLKKLTDEAEQESRWKAEHHVSSPDATEISMSVFLTEERDSGKTNEI